jgi:outer membrane protein assembly factor BamB
MIYRAFIKRTSFIFIFTFIFMLLYISPCTNFSAVSTSNIPSSVLRPTTVPGSSDPTEDEWPMFRGQLNHTGEAHTFLIIHSTVFWTFPTEDYIDSSPTVVDGRVYVGCRDSLLYCLNAITGEQLWTYLTGEMIYTSSPAVAGGLVYVGNNNGQVFCLNASTGKFIWVYNTGSAVFSSPAVSGGRVYVGSLDYKFYCLNATTGDEIWISDTEGYAESSPAVANGRVYVGDSKNKIYCFNATSGNSLWNYTTDSLVISSPAVAGERIYVGSQDYHIYCLNALTGTQLWNFTTGGYVDSSPAVAGGLVYVGSNDCNVYCLNATTGTKLWNYTTGAEVFSSPAVAGGRLYVGSNDYNFYCLNATTGGLLWSFTDPAHYPWTSSPAVVGGRVYVGNYDRQVFCLPTFLDRILPSYTAITESANPLELGSTETITITGVADFFGIQTVRIAFEETNHTMTNQGDGTWDYSNWTPSNVGNFPYSIYIQDTSGNWNATSGIIQVVDTTLPVYSDVIESSPLELGSNEVLRITGVIDLAGIATVCVNFEGINHSMFYEGSCIWLSDGWIPNATGDYPYTIYVGDINRNWNATSGTSQVIDTTPPEYSAVIESADPLEQPLNETIVITGVTDLSGIQIVLLEFEGSNHTMNDEGGGIWIYSNWKPTEIMYYQYTIYIGDTMGNWNFVFGMIQVIEGRPSWVAVTESADPLEVDGLEAITIMGVADPSGISTVLINFEGFNFTMFNMGGGVWVFNWFAPLIIGLYPYTIYIGDNIGNWNEISGEINVVSAIPTYTSVIESADPLELGSAESITIAGVADLSGIQTVLIAFEGTNHTMTNLGGGVWRYSTWIPSDEGEYLYTIYIQDMKGNWNATSGTIQVNRSTSPPNLEPFLWILALSLIGMIIFTIFLYRHLNKKIQKVSQPKPIPPKDLPKKLKDQ